MDTLVHISCDLLRARNHLMEGEVVILAPDATFMPTNWGNSIKNELSYPDVFNKNYVWIMCRNE